jgi:hypothetical protein
MVQKLVTKEQTNVTPAKLVYKPVYFEDGGNIFLRNFGKVPPEYKA